LVAGADATIESSIVRDTSPQLSDAEFGYGIIVQPDPETNQASTARIRACVIRQDGRGHRPWIGTTTPLERCAARGNDRLQP
jgi:hypothetical protein